MHDMEESTLHGYHRLVEIYGKPTVVDQKADGLLKSSLVELNIVYGEAKSLKKVPGIS